MKINMAVFLNSFYSHVSKVISKLFICPEGDEDSWFEITVKDYNAHSKVHYALLQALNDDDVSSIETWKIKMCSYLKALGLHVYLAITKRSYINNDKYAKLNA